MRLADVEDGLHAEEVRRTPQGSAVAVTVTVTVAVTVTVQSSPRPAGLASSPRCVAAQARNRELLAARDAEARLHRIVTAPPFPRTLYYTLPSAVTVL